MSALADRLAPWRFVAAYLRTRWLARRLRTRDDVMAWQSGRLASWQRRVLARVPFYRERAKGPFESLPVTDKAMVMADFAAFNGAGVSAAAGWTAFTGSGRVGRYIVGASTGTSGNRGLFVISEAERWEWLGVIVAKTLGRLARARVALILPLNTRLYEAAGRSGLIALRFFDLNRGLADIAGEVAAFGPDTVIAPPRVLRYLVEAGVAIRPRRVFSGAEVLDPLDREVIETGFGVTVREIYMATEGLLGVACARGTLHLCEDVVKFEFEPVADSDLVVPIITDFTRSTQAMARYRMNDLLRLAASPCACGSPLRAVAAIEGRRDDAMTLCGPGGEVVVTPDVLRNAVVDADRRIDDFRLVQTGPKQIELTLRDALPEEAAAAAAAALARLFARLGVTAELRLSRVSGFTVSARKLRRVERRVQG
ncbi:MAG: CoF synthetase [Devosia sp.]|nr:CoF synthetase [Devosia sp.]